MYEGIEKILTPTGRTSIKTLEGARIAIRWEWAERNDGGWAIAEEDWHRPARRNEVKLLDLAASNAAEIAATARESIAEHQPEVEVSG